MASKKRTSIQSENKRFIGVFMKPFISGSKIQLERYLEAQRIMKSNDMIGSYADRCLFELSSLFEHLATLQTYLKRVGIELRIGSAITDFRNHIRHDARGELDARSEKRAERLGIDEKLQTQIAFTDNGVKVGSTILNASELNHFIEMADIVAQALFLGGKIEINGDEIKVYQSGLEIITKSTKES